MSLPLSLCVVNENKINIKRNDNDNNDDEENENKIVIDIDDYYNYNYDYCFVFVSFHFILNRNCNMAKTILSQNRLIILLLIDLEIKYQIILSLVFFCKFTAKKTKKIQSI